MEPTLGDTDEEEEESCSICGHVHGADGACYDECWSELCHLTNEQARAELRKMAEHIVTAYGPALHDLAKDD